jgi:lipid A ethanolaminephosphotransferase
MLKKINKLNFLALYISLVNLILYHFPFYKFVFENADLSSVNGIVLLSSITILLVILNALVFYIGLFLLRKVGKWILVLFFIINAIALYFINTYGVIIDKTMIGNILNTNFEESSSFLSIKMVIYLVFLGILPSVLLLKTPNPEVKFKKFMVTIGLTLLFVLSLAFANSSNWLWIDKNSKALGALVMPWSYVVNTSRFYYHKSQKNEKQIPLPHSKVVNQEKSIFVLVIGESARSQNFSLYGYPKNTNPLLSKIENVKSYKAESCATYTTAGVKCILEYKNTGKLFEILPNYLFKNNDIDVIWRTTNWGEPTVRIKNFQDRKALKKLVNDDSYNYDEILLKGLKEQILTSKKNKILVVLHTSTSHGPTYFKKYPPKFNKFLPVCTSVELANCTQNELINAYDNTILYTDYILATLIGDLKQLPEYNSTMLFLSDHGESLGEKNLYMHGLPVSIAPKEQLDIPFIVWVSKGTEQLKNNGILSQHHVFHSVMDFLGVESSIYDQNMSIYKPKKKATK